MLYFIISHKYLHPPSQVKSPAAQATGLFYF